jgi:hypothetical protein
MDAGCRREGLGDRYARLRDQAQANRAGGVDRREGNDRHASRREVERADMAEMLLAVHKGGRLNNYIAKRLAPMVIYSFRR